MKKNILTIILIVAIHFSGTPLLADEGLPVVMVTGYWNPSGQMIAPFCTDTSLNPGGWIGGNWEGLGYNVYSFFPEPGVYTGMFEVDYQATWEDFWRITDSLHPEAIISYGVGPVAPNYDWEFEYNARNLEDEWSPDPTEPVKPTPCPPDSTKPAGYTRHPVFPFQKVIDALDAETTVQALVDWDGQANFFLCEYMAYLGMWYQNLHSLPDDPYPCHASGFIHITNKIPLAESMKAVSVTIREVIKSINTTSSKVAIHHSKDKIALQVDYNPYSSLLLVSFTLPQRQNITLDLYNLSGKRVTTLTSGYGKMGENSIEFNTRSIPSGIFFCRLKTAGIGDTSKKIIICK